MLVARHESNGKYKFFTLKNRGHVLSAKALKEMKSSYCLVCNREFDEREGFRDLVLRVVLRFRDLGFFGVGEWREKDDIEYKLNK